MDPLPGDAVAAQPPWCREIEIKLFQTCQSRSEVGRQFNQTPAPVDSLFPSPGCWCHLRDQGNTGVSDHFPIFYVWTIIRFCSPMWQKTRFLHIGHHYALKREQNRISGAVCSGTESAAGTGTMCTTSATSAPSTPPRTGSSAAGSSTGTNHKKSVKIG